MVRRTKDEGGTAVVDRTSSPDDIAARVAAADAEARRMQAMADVRQWREIATAIADGHEPDGKTFAAVGDLARRLRLPPDAVARSVKAVAEERRLQGECDRTRQRLVEVKSREAELAAEMKAAEAKLLALREELAGYMGLHQGYPFQAMAVAGVKAEHPLLFADLAHVADRLIAAEAGMGTATFAAMKPQEWSVEGHSSRSTFGG